MLFMYLKPMAYSSNMVHLQLIWLIETCLNQICRKEGICKCFLDEFAFHDGLKQGDNLPSLEQ
jgi:hypothetical protein